jgi:hypothetical protein
VPGLRTLSDSITCAFFAGVSKRQLQNKDWRTNDGCMHSLEKEPELEIFHLSIRKNKNDSHIELDKKEALEKSHKKEFSLFAISISRYSYQKQEWFLPCTRGGDLIRGITIQNKIGRF